MSTVLSPKRSRPEPRNLGGVGVVTFPIVTAGFEPLLRLIDVIYPMADMVFVITGGAGSALLQYRTYDRCVVDSVDHEESQSAAMRVLHFTATQFKIILKLVRRAKFVSFWLFYQGGDYVLLPVLFAKLSRRPVVIVMPSSQVNIMRAKKDALARPARLLVETTLRLADRIVTFSPRLVEEWQLGKVRDKVVFLNHPLGWDAISIKPLSERQRIVGYVGRFSEEKGLPEFVESISLILEKDQNLLFWILGDGHLREQIEATLARKSLNDRVKLLGWVPHEDLPRYLSELKLLVIPSYTEGIPNIMIEAMLCETPVLSTKVGSAPVYIQDGETGFLMDTNEPPIIAKNCVRALDAPNSERLVKKARDIALANFSYETVREGWRKVLSSLLDERRRA